MSDEHIFQILTTYPIFCAAIGVYTYCTVSAEMKGSFCLSLTLILLSLGHMYVVNACVTATKDIVWSDQKI